MLIKRPFMTTSSEARNTEIDWTREWARDSSESGRPGRLLGCSEEPCQVVRRRTVESRVRRALLSRAQGSRSPGGTLHERERPSQHLWCRRRNDASRLAKASWRLRFDRVRAPPRPAQELPSLHDRAVVPPEGLCPAS